MYNIPFNPYNPSTLHAMHNHLPTINRAFHAPRPMPHALYPLFLALLFLLTVLVSCEPSEDTETTPPVPRIKEMAFYMNGSLYDTKTFEYDQQGRQVKSTTISGYSESYTYEAGKVVLVVSASSYDDPVTLIYVLNNKGIMLSAEKNNDSYVSGYVFDAQGYLIRSEGVVTTINTIENGNNVSTETWLTAENINELQYVETRSYLNDRPNTIGNENVGITFQGKQDKNPVERSAYLEVIPDRESVITYQYEYDAQNRIIKSSRSDIPNAYTLYTYME